VRPRGAVARRNGSRGGCAAVLPGAAGDGGSRATRRGYFARRLRRGAIRAARRGKTGCGRGPSERQQSPERALVLAPRTRAQPRGRHCPGRTARARRPSFAPARTQAGAAWTVAGRRVAGVYVERGGRTLLSWNDDGAVAPSAVAAGAEVRDGDAREATVVKRRRGAGRRRIAADAGPGGSGFRPTPQRTSGSGAG